jgi:MFS family permease
MPKKNDAERTVKVFSAASFLNDFGSDMIYPIWPLFVTSLGADMEMLGLIDGLGDAFVSISQAISGYLSDKFKKRKIFVWTGYLAGGLSRLGYALSHTWQWLIPFKILDRAGKMRGAPRDAMIADVSTNKNRGTNFGLLRTMDNLGATVGIITTILLLNLLQIDLRTIMFIAAVPSFIGALAVWLLIRDRKTKNIFKGIHLKDFSTNFKIFIFLSAIFSLASFSYSFLLILAKNIGLVVQEIPLLYLLFTAVASLTSLKFGQLADRFGRKSVLTFSYLLFAGVCAFSVYMQNLAGIVIVFILYGLHQGSMQTVQRTFVSELSPKEIRSSMLGTYQMVVGIFALPASLVAGFLWDAFGSTYSFGFSLVLSLVAVGLMFFVKETI